MWRITTEAGDVEVAVLDAAAHQAGAGQVDRLRNPLGTQTEDPMAGTTMTQSGPASDAAAAVEAEEVEAEDAVEAVAVVGFEG